MLTVCGGLIVVTVTQHGVRGGVIKAGQSRLQEKSTCRLGQKAVEMRLTPSRLISKFLQEEKNSLEAQETCMRNLDQFNTIAVEKENK